MTSHAERRFLRRIAQRAEARIAAAEPRQEERRQAERRQDPPLAGEDLERKLRDAGLHGNRRVAQRRRGDERRRSQR